MNPEFFTLLNDYFHASIHKARRDKFLNEHDNEALVLISNLEQPMSNDVTYVFRQNSDFYYFSGFPEPESAMILFKPKNGEAKYWLFVRPRDESEETWTGYRYGPERAKTIFQADETFVNTEFPQKLEEVMKQVNAIYYNFNVNKAMDEILLGALPKAHRNAMKEGTGALTLYHHGLVTNKYRLIKDHEEIELLRKAGEIAALAHVEAMKHVKPGMYEYELEGILDQTFKKHGGKRHAYPPIIGSGENATILHYIENRRQMQAGDLVLIDAGVEYYMYNSDITRTFPVNGRFTKPQREIYEVVLKAQEEAINLVQPGVRYSAMHEKAVEILVEGMLDLGILTGEKQDIIENEKYKDYYMHSTGHWLGLDTHDPCPYKNQSLESIELQPGMVFTVEPGIYIAPYKDAPEDYKGIGIRIEDDILVTENGYEILTKAVPKTIPEIESLILNK